jgi:probable DNA metabolism protein
MRNVRLTRAADAGEWRRVARALLLARVPPDGVDWSCGKAADLFGGAREVLPSPVPIMPPPRVPRSFLDLAEMVICHSDPERFALLYRLLWRLQQNPGLIDFAPDPDVQRLRRMQKAVRRDCHKMKAFVRFRELREVPSSRRRFVAWFEPDHHIVARTAPFFAKRFGDMDWMILTPKGSAGFDGCALTISDIPASPPDLEDAIETLWTTYFAAIFNPARLKVKAMQAEMPKKYWKNLPEAVLIPGLIAGAEARMANMANQQHRAPPAFHRRIVMRNLQQPASAEENSETISAVPGARNKSCRD